MKDKLRCACVPVMPKCTMQALGLSEDGLQDALRRVAAVKLSKLSNLVRLYLPVTPLLFWLYVTCILRLPHMSADSLVLQDEAFRRLLCHWVLPHAQQGPSSSPFLGLFTPVSMVSTQPPALAFDAMLPLQAQVLPLMHACKHRPCVQLLLQRLHAMMKLRDKSCPAHI